MGIVHYMQNMDNNYILVTVLKMRYVTVQTKGLF